MLFVFESFGQNSVLGIAFGSTRSEVIAEMKKKGYKKYDAIRNVVEFKEKINFGKFTLFNAEFQFTPDGKFCDARLYLVNDIPSNLLKEYEEVVTELSKKYGKGESTKKYNNNYKQIVEAKILAEVKAETTTYKHRWDFPGMAIEVVLMSSPNIAIHYQNDNISDESERLANEKVAKDYGNGFTGSHAFFDVPRNATKSAVMAVMKKRGLVHNSLFKKKLEYNAPLNFGGFQATRAIFNFDDNERLINISVRILPSKESEIINLYDEVVNALSYIYGEGASKTPNWDESAKRNPEFRVGRIRYGNSKYYHEHKWTQSQTAVQLNLNHELVLDINYINVPLAEAFEVKERIRRAEDY